MGRPSRVAHRLRLLIHALMFSPAALCLPATLSAHELRFGEASGLEPELRLELVSDSEVQGLVAAFDWEGAAFTGLNLVDGPSVAGADLIVRRVEPSYMVFGVVMDTDGRDAAVLAPGTSHIATASFRCVSPGGAVPPFSAVTFRDGIYGTNDLGPDLQNLITIGGNTVSAIEGLVLTPGRLVCPVVEPGTLRIRDTVVLEGSLCAPVDVILDTPSPVQGFALAIAHDPLVLELTNITIAGTATEANGADFSVPAIFAAGGTLGVVMDFSAPFLDNTIPIGAGQVIARYTYCCRAAPPEGGPNTVSTLRFQNGVLGDPPIDNVLVVEGRSITPLGLTPGTFTCLAGEGGGGPQEFHCGGDPTSPGAALPPVVGFPGSTVKLCFFYRSIPKDTPGDTGEDQIQGLSMALCFDPRFVQCQEGTFDITGTITEAVGAEFVNHHCENSADDGDGGELVIGILVDAIPPFDGATLPPTLDLLKIGCIDFKIAPDAPCNQCFPVTFCDGINGRGRVLTRNLISVNNFSKSPELFNCEICVAATPAFQRGDCNFSRGGAMALDIADSRAVISFLFGDDDYLPPCLDACDANDDGRVDFADAVYDLRYLFMSGSPPPAPGPKEPGPDPSEDQLGCDGGAACQPR